jgi:hypothetical protein
VINVDDRVPQRMTTGIEHDMSIAASTDNAGRPRRTADRVRAGERKLDIVLIELPRK